jgi:hypothetical protein
MEEHRAEVPKNTPVNGLKAESSHRVPRRFRSQLIAVGVLQALIAIARPSVTSFVWVGLTGLATWKTLECNRAASRALSAMLVVDAVMLYAVASGVALRSLMVGGAVLALALYVLILAGCLILSPSMRVVLRKSKAWTVAKN